MLKSVVTERKVWCVASPTVLLMSVFHVTFTSYNPENIRKSSGSHNYSRKIILQCKTSLLIWESIKYFVTSKEDFLPGFFLNNKTNPQTTLKITLKQPKSPTYPSFIFLSNLSLKKVTGFQLLWFLKLLLNWNWLWRDVIRQHCPLASPGSGSSEVWSE